MSNVGLLILFSILGAAICAKTRSAAGAVVFSLIALVLFVGTPVGRSVPGVVGKVMSTVDQATTPTLDGGGQRADDGGSR
jgi:hypothetical protein